MLSHTRPARFARIRRAALAAFCGALVLPALTVASEIERYGEPLREAKEIRIAELLEDPEQFVDQRVRVVGLVDDVCPMKGCWVDLIEKQGSEKVRFKVQDDVIVFPASAKGQEIVAEGVVKAIDLDLESARQWFAHEAEEKGESFDPESIQEAVRIYQIAGEGAELRPASH